MAKEPGTGWRKRLSPKQKAARRRNIAVARAAKKKGPTRKRMSVSDFARANRAMNRKEKWRPAG